MRTEISYEIQINASRVEGVYHIPSPGKGTRICELEKKFSKYPKTSTYRSAKQKIGSAVEDKRHKNKGRTRKLTSDNNDITDQSVEVLQTNKGIFTSRDVL